VVSWYLISLLLATVARSVAVPDLTATTEWWKRSVCYEVFVRSFYDSNGDGIGDLKGLIAKLDYINDGDPRSKRSLGANCIWLMPIAKSPSYHGYDVTDYYHVNPDYGTDADFRELVKQAHRRGIKVIVDFVPNHTSSAHPAFQAALRDTASPYRDWYRWAKKKPSQPGPWKQEVWHKSPVRDEYYYGLFWAGMPDLNYEKPAALAEMEKVAAYWVNAMGVDGFRLDAVSHLIEKGDVLQNAPGTNAVLRKFAEALNRLRPRPFTIGEVWTDSASMLARYYPDQLDSYFAFAVADATLNAAQSGDARRLSAALADAITSLPAGRWSPLLTNHDQPRVMTRLAGDNAKARIAAMTLLSLPGMPFIYYGEEIGMAGDKPDEQIRTPMQWTSAPSVGFTTGKAWENSQQDARTRNVQAQHADRSSLLTLYRQLVHLRQQHDALAMGSMEMLTSGDTSIVAFLRRSPRETALVVINFSERGRSSMRFTVPSSNSARRAQPIFGNPSSAAVVGNQVTVDGIAPRQAYWIVLR
jgi:alpha-amylase